MAESSQSNRRMKTRWRKSEIEKLITWMEDNQEKVLGKQSYFTDVKQEIFSNEDHVTTKRIRQKIVNMRTAWTKAKASQDQTGWGLNVEDKEFFWRVDAIWGMRRNAAPMAIEATSNTHTTLKEDSETIGSDTSSSIKGCMEAKKGEPDSMSLKRILEDPEESTNKRLNLRKEMEQQPLNAEDQRLAIKIYSERKLFEQRIESNEQIAQIQSNTTAEVARIQAETRFRQFQALTNLIDLVINKSKLEGDGRREVIKEEG